MTKASIIMVTYNSHKWLRASLDSIFLLDDLNDSEVIVVDNGSTDGTQAFIKANYPAVKLIQSTNLGFGAGSLLNKNQSPNEYYLL